MKTYTAKIWTDLIRPICRRAIEIKICAIFGLYTHISPLLDSQIVKKSRREPLSCQLSYPDSNQDKQNQNLLCYHYTIRQSPIPKRACKYSFFTLFGYQQIVIFLTALQHDISAVHQVCLSKDA